VQKKIGPAWTERGRPANGYLTKRLAEDWLRETLDPRLRALPHRAADLLGPQPRDTIEQIIPLANGAGLSMTHLAMGFSIAHPGVTSAISGPRTHEQLDDLSPASR
jgi:aryl-alcohol dehydrogenase-like predicted oxidoreductase